MLKPWPRRKLLALALGGTLAIPALPRQSFAAADGGLSKLREVPGGRAIPEGLAFRDAAGQETGFAAFQGKGLIVNFWATWCAPCVAEMPSLDRAQAALEPDGIRILALSSDRGGQGVVEPFYRRTGIAHLAMWFDPRGAVGRAFGIRGLPTTLLLDRGGREVGRLEGEAEWDRPGMLAAIRRLLGTSDTTSST